MVLRILKHIKATEKDDFLDKESVQFSIKRNLGLITDKQKVPPAELGIAEIRVDVYKNFHTPISHL